MLNVEQATAIVLEHANLLPSEAVSIDIAAGRILQEPILADRDFPPFNRVAMDGIAIRYQEFESGQQKFPIMGMIAAGASPTPLQAPGGCIEVATGAVLPQGADTVIPYEQIKIVDQSALVETTNVIAGQHIHRQGGDRKKGDLLLSPGQKLGAAEMSILATVGKTQVEVSKLIRTAIIATGDELVKIEATPLPWQIRQSNATALQTLLSTQPVMIQTFLAEDDFNKTKILVEKILADYDLVLLSGGVSAGKKDFVPELLESLGVNILFHKVTQRPGKPLLFGQAPNGPTVFALPGNPVSCFMCTCRYVFPWIQRSLGIADIALEWAFLAEPLEFKPDLTWFVPVAIKNELGVLRAYAKPGHGSGDLANLHEGDGFLELPKGRDWYGAEEAFPFHRYR